MLRKVVGLLTLAAMPFISVNAEAHVRFHHHHHSWHYRYHHHSYRHHARHALHAGPEVASIGVGESGGLASWYYGRGGGLTAAHRSFPFGTRVLVTNRNNGRTVVVRINDRGPFIAGRIIDLNRTAASAIGVTGVSPVSIRRL